MNIGVFDSGLGGLTIFNELVKQLPQYNYIYLGDNARVPYGGRSTKIIYEFTRQAVDFLFKKDCALIILACNTATANALRRIQQEYLPKNYPERRVLGVVRPTVEVVVESNAKRVGILATRATVTSKGFVKEIYKLNPKIKVFQNAGPLLVPFIEERETDTEGFNMILKKYLQPLLNNFIDTLILGCTHYGLVEKQIKKIVGKAIRVINEGEIVAYKLDVYLKNHPEICNRLSKLSERNLLVTDINSLQYYEVFTKYSQTNVKFIKVIIDNKRI